MMLRTSILIVSYNTREMTLDCLRSVFEQTAAGTFEVIVVDNQSSDGSADAIESEFPNVRVIRSKANLGFAGGNNLAAAGATGEYLLLLNPDTVVQDDAVGKLVAFAQANPEAGIWGGRTVFAEGSLNPASCWRRMTTWSLACQALALTKIFPSSAAFNPEAYGGWKRDSVREIDIVSGCFLLIRRSLWERLGGFDESFFMYGEEADLCLRARKLGARPMITPDATIVHYGAASERVRADKHVRLLAAKALLIQKHWRPGSRGIGMALLTAWPLGRAIAGRFAWLLLSASQRDATRAWREVWRRRRLWMGGRFERPLSVPSVKSEGENDPVGRVAIPS